jgi:type I restriction enzyme, S subunit
MKKFKLSDLLDSWDTGAWGEPTIDQTKAVSVLRSTNFLNSGELSLKNLALLDVPAGTYRNKQLFPTDILLERSGGGENQPVGRVVIFREQGRFICGNFISCLRVKKEIIDSKYLLLRLLYFHWSGQTEKFQTATTGIRNLQMKEYLNQELLIPNITNQYAIVSTLKAQLTEVEIARKALEYQQRDIVDLANAYIRESIEKTVGAGHAREKCEKHDTRNLNLNNDRGHGPLLRDWGMYWMKSNKESVQTGRTILC